MTDAIAKGTHSGTSLTWQAWFSNGNDVTPKGTKGTIWGGCVGLVFGNPKTKAVAICGIVGGIAGEYLEYEQNKVDLEANWRGTAQLDFSCEVLDDGLAYCR